LNPILKKLFGTDRRSIGRSDEVVAEVLADPTLFDAVFEECWRGPAAAAADAVKITAQHPEYLCPTKANSCGKSPGLTSPKSAGTWLKWSRAST
jgi:hypothetical protein